MHTVTHGECAGAGVPGHLQIIFGIANHQRLLCLHSQLIQQLVDHRRIWLGGGLIGTSCGKKPLFQTALFQNLSQSHTALAGGDGEPVAVPLQLLQHSMNTWKQG